MMISQFAGGAFRNLGNRLIARAARGRAKAVAALAAAAICASFAQGASAWSFKEHISYARMAAERIVADPATPPELKAWVHSAVPGMLDMDGEHEYFLHAKIGREPEGFKGVLHWVYVPDVRQEREKTLKVEPFGVPEAKLHFIDIEFFGKGEHGYQHDLSAKPRLEDVPHDLADPRYQQSGMLPLRVEQCYRELVKSLRDGRVEPAFDDDENYATVWAAFLAHYAADNTQPQHATLDYKSASYFSDKRNAPNVHAEVEYRMCDDAKDEFPELRAEFWPKFEAELKAIKDPTKSDDPFTATLEVSLASYDALPLIGLAAMEATGQQGTPDHPTGKAGPFDTEKFFRFRGQMNGREMSVMDMKAHQTAWAVARIERLWRQAWKEAHEPAPATTAPATQP